MMLQSFGLSFLPFLDALAGFASDLLSSVDLYSPSKHGGEQLIDGLENSDETSAKPIRVLEDSDSDPVDWPLWTLDLLDTSHVHLDAVFPCACSLAGAPSAQPPHEDRQRTPSVIISRRPPRSSSLRLLAARHERYLTYAVVVATLQVFLRLTRANATTLLLPMLSQATGRSRGAAAALAGDAVLVLVNACGVLASARAARQLGREAMCAIGGVLIVLCQIAVEAMAGAGLVSGSARMAGGHAASMFAAACAVSCGSSWAWGALFWAVPGEGIRSAGQAAGAALGFGLGFAQMQCFLLTLRQLKHAAFAYYAVWIWS